MIKIILTIRTGIHILIHTCWILVFLISALLSLKDGMIYGDARDMLNLGMELVHLAGLVLSVPIAMICILFISLKVGLYKERINTISIIANLVAGFINSVIVVIMLLIMGAVSQDDTISSIFTCFIITIAIFEAIGILSGIILIIKSMLTKYKDNIKQINT